RHRGEGIHLGRRGVGDEQHVRLVDGLESADRGAVEAEPVLEDVFSQLGYRDGEMLPETGHVDEAQIDDLDALLLRHLQHFLRGHSPASLSAQCWVGKTAGRGSLSWPHRPPTISVCPGPVKRAAASPSGSGGVWPPPASSLRRRRSFPPSSTRRRKPSLRACTRSPSAATDPARPSRPPG